VNQILQWLSTGDLRSDGLSNQVADIVINNVAVFDDLFDGLSVSDDVVRGHSADALEKIARKMPELFIDRIPEIIRSSQEDTVAMVRWHLAMTLGHLTCYPEKVEDIYKALTALLQDDSVFVKSWAISSLCIIGRTYPERRDEIIGKITTLQLDDSIAFRSRVRNALRLLTDENTPFPKGWVKSEHLKFGSGT
jgi:hypothetical protein